MKVKGTQKFARTFRNSVLAILFLCVLQFFSVNFELRAQSKTERIDVGNIYLRGIESIDGKSSGNRFGITSSVSLGAGYDSGYDELVISSDFGFYFKRRQNPFSKVKAGIAFPVFVETGYGSLDLGCHFQLGFLLSKSVILELRAGPMLYNYDGSLVLNGRLRFKFNPEKRTGFFFSLARIYNHESFDGYGDRIIRLNFGFFF